MDLKYDHQMVVEVTTEATTVEVNYNTKQMIRPCLSNRHMRTVVAKSHNAQPEKLRSLLLR